MTTPVLISFWLYDPKRPARSIQRASLPMLACKRTVWALLPNGRRKLLGTSAFFTLRSAQRAQLGELRSKAQNKYLRMNHPGVHDYYTNKYIQALAASKGLH